MHDSKRLVFIILFFLAYITIQIGLYIYYYNDFGKVKYLLVDSEVVYYSNTKPLLIGPCSRVFSKLFFPDPMFYSYPASFIALVYLFEWYKKTSIKPGVMFIVSVIAVYIAIIWEEWILSNDIMGIFRSVGFRRIELNFTWMMDDFLTFLVLSLIAVAMGSSVLSYFRGWSTTDPVKDYRAGRSLLLAWISVMSGWIVPWVFYGVVFNNIVDIYCKNDWGNSPWLAKLYSLSGLDALLGIVSISFYTGLYLGLLEEIKNKARSQGLDGYSRREISGVIASTAIGASYILQVKSLIARASVLFENGVADIVIDLYGCPEHLDFFDIFVLAFNTFLIAYGGFSLGKRVYFSLAGRLVRSG